MSRFPSLARSGALAALLATSLAPPAAASLEPPETLEVRRWEYIVLIRASQQVNNPIGHVETAALKAGAAVLETLRSEVGPSHSDYRLLVRTRDPELIHEVLREMQRVPGVLGASTVQLPETPTHAGGPEFISSYTSELDENPNDPRVVVRHDLPPLLDKKDLLANVPLPAGPTTGYVGTGGFTLNASELFNRLRESSWRKREEKMKSGYLPILPPESGDGSSESR